MTSESPLVSVLFVTWRRFDSLKETVESFLRHTSYPNLELIIADDGSEPEIQAQIRRLPVHKFSLPHKHRGLGANNNSGLRLCTGKYVLMIQDDWPCRGPADYLANAVAVLEANSQVGIINFAAANHPPDYSQRLKGSDEPCYITPRPLEGTHKEEFLYSDQPHIQTRASLEYVGFYKEDRDMEECENDYNIRWRDQDRFSTAVFPAYFHRVFTDEGKELSFRTTRFRYRVAAALQPLKPTLERISPAATRWAKSIVQWALRRIERARLVR